MPGLTALLGPPGRERTREELLDAMATDGEELAGNLRDIARLNRLGPIRSLLRHVAPFVARHRGREPFRILDLGTGSADVPVAIARWARTRGHRVRVVGLDHQRAVARHAQAMIRAEPEVRVVVGEARRPPIRPGTVDLAICSLLLHHLPEAAVVAVLRGLAETARLGFVVSDLRRGRTAWLAAWLLTRVLSRNRLTRHDGPLSVRRAYTVAELTRLSAAAGLATVRWQCAPAFRLIGVYERAP